MAYHIAQSGEKAGEAVTCPAKNQCTLREPDGSFSPHFDTKNEGDKWAVAQRHAASGGSHLRGSSRKTGERKSPTRKTDSSKNAAPQLTPEQERAQFKKALYVLTHGDVATTVGNDEIARAKEEEKKLKFRMDSYNKMGDYRAVAKTRMELQEVTAKVKRYEELDSNYQEHKSMGIDRMRLHLYNSENRIATSNYVSKVAEINRLQAKMKAIPKDDDPNSINTLQWNVLASQHALANREKEYIEDDLMERFKKTEAKAVTSEDVVTQGRKLDEENGALLSKMHKLDMAIRNGDVQDQSRADNKRELEAIRYKYEENIRKMREMSPTGDAHWFSKNW